MLPTTHKFSVYRYLKTDNTEEYNSESIYANVDTFVIPASTEIIMTYQGIPGNQLFEGTTQESITLQNGDKLVQGSEVYIIKDTPQVVDNNYLFYIKLVLQKVV